MTFCRLDHIGHIETDTKRPARHATSGPYTKGAGDCIDSSLVMEVMNGVRQAPHIWDFRRLALDPRTMRSSRHLSVGGLLKYNSWDCFCLCGLVYHEPRKSAWRILVLETLSCYWTSYQQKRQRSLKKVNRGPDGVTKFDVRMQGVEGTKLTKLHGDDATTWMDRNR